MDKKKWTPTMKVVISVIMGILVLLLIVIATSTPDSAKPVPAEKIQETVQEFYAQLKTLHTTVNTAYAMAAKKATQGNIQGAYADFKSPVQTMVRMGISKATDLENSVPNVPDKELLKEAANYLGLSFYRRDKAISAFLEGVEENNQGKFVESRTENDKADEYLSQATAAFEKIESKYGLGK